MIIAFIDIRLFKQLSNSRKINLSIRGKDRWENW